MAANVFSEVSKSRRRKPQQQHFGASVTSLLLNASILAGVLHAAAWSQLTNYQSLPSDCPNRVSALRPEPKT